MHALAFTATLLVLASALWLTARVVLHPTVLTAQEVQGSFRFHLVDSLWLSAQIQVALAVIVAWVPRIYPEYFATVTAFGVFATIALWAGAIQFLSQAGIVVPLKRGIFVLVYLPGTLLLMIGAAVVIFGTPILIFEGHNFDSRLVAAAGVGLLALIAALGYGLRQLGWWLVGGYPNRHDRNSTTSSDLLSELPVAN